MHDLNSAFSEISEEAILLHNQILDAAKDNPQIKELYKGCQLLFSPLISKPKFLLKPLIETTKSLRISVTHYTQLPEFA